MTLPHRLVALHKELVPAREVLSIRALESMNIGINPEIYCDAAEPARIEEIHRSSFNARPAEKDVVDGIDFLKRFRRMTGRDSPNLIREFSRYNWKTDKDDKPLDEPVKFDDHLCDAARYAIYTHLRKRIGRPKFEVIWA
jgi:phage terminase large subunit